MVSSSSSTQHRGASDISLFWKAFVAYAFRVKNIQSAGGNRQHDEEELIRSLSVLDLIMMGVGGSIGAGIFVLTGIAAREAGPAIIISFGLAAAACILNALCYAEMSSRFAVSGSAYLYTILAFGEFPALLVGINLLFDYHVGAATISRSMSVYFVKMLNGWHVQIPSEFGEYEVNSAVNVSVLAPFFLCVFTIILVRGVKESKWTNLVLTSLKIFIVLLVVIGGASKVEASNWTPLAPKGASSIFSATSTVFFSYIGFDVVANAAEEARNPSRDLPIAIVSSLGICALLYCLVSLILTGLVPYQDISESAPLSDALSTAKLAWGQQMINIGATVGLGTTLLTGMYAQSRLYLSITRDGLLPQILGHVSGTLRVPVFAQIWCGIIAALLATPFDVEALSKFLSIGIMLAYSLVCWSILSFRSAHNRPALGWIGCYSLLALCMSISIRLQFPFYVSVILVAATLFTWIPIFRFPFDAAVPERSGGGGMIAQSSQTTYRCPFVPLIPLLGLGSNIFMAVQLHWEAWVRLGVVSLLVLCLYIYRAWSVRATAMHGSGSGDTYVYDKLNFSVVENDGKGSASSSSNNNNNGLGGGGGGEINPTDGGVHLDIGGIIPELRGGVHLDIGGIPELRGGNHKDMDDVTLLQEEKEEQKNSTAPTVRVAFADDNKNHNNIQIKENNNWNGLPIRSEGSIGGYLSATEEESSDVFFKNSPTRTTNHSNQSSKHA